MENLGLPELLPLVVPMIIIGFVLLLKYWGVF